MVRCSAAVLVLAGLFTGSSLLAGEKPWARHTIDDSSRGADGVRLSDGVLEIPHPRLAERLFVLGPLRDIAPDWRHPVTGIGIAELVAALGPGQKIRRLR